MPNYEIDPIVKHRREVRRLILLPVVLPTTILMAIMVLLFFLTITDALSMGQLRVISDIMMISCILCPTAITFLIFDLVFIGMLWGTDKIPASVKPLARSIRYMTEGIADFTAKTTRRVATPVMGMETRLTRWGSFIATLFGFNRNTQTKEQE